MIEQLSLPGVEPARQPTDRLFFALVPDAEAISRIGALSDTLRGLFGTKARWQAPERLHVTLCLIGDYAGLPDHIVEAARTAASSITASAFDVTFDRAMSFGGKEAALPFVLRAGAGNDDIVRLHDALAVALRRAGARLRPDTHCTPHMTLLRHRQTVAVRPVEPVSWSVREIVLVHSLLGKTQHVVLGRWPLLTH